MKRRNWLIAGAVLAVLVLGWIFRESILDALPIDQSGWVQQDGHTRYLNEKGDPLTGWQEIDGKRYYFTAEGSLCTGWQEVDGKTYYLSHDGTMANGWITLEGQHYYLLPDGARASGSVQIDGKAHHFSSEGTPLSGWQKLGDSRCYLDSHGAALTGWQEIEGSRYYLAENGSPLTGWQEIGGRRYFFGESGIAHSGWLEQEGKRYYLTDSGIARGRHTVEGKDYFFTSTGANIIVVNPWNYIPEDYQPELVNIYGYYGQVDASCVDALERMLADCREAGGRPNIASSYRTHETQAFLHNRMLADYISMDYDEDEAFEIVRKISAVPGTSEHQLGLAVDIVDSRYTKLDNGQTCTLTQIWLMEHCWEYGFILRYPKGATEWTGIIFEPWHYRYVGTELAMELRDLDICLEEYLHNLTEE